MATAGCRVSEEPPAGTGMDTVPTTQMPTEDTAPVTQPTEPIPTEPVDPTADWEMGYIAAPGLLAAYYDEFGTPAGVISRGSWVKYEISPGETRIAVNGTVGILEESAGIVADMGEVVPAHTLYVRTAVNLRDPEGKLLETFAEKGTEVSVTGCDFVYEDHRIYDGAYTTEGLPTAYGEAQTLSLTLSDKKFSGIKLVLNYTVFEECDVIFRNVELINNDCGAIYIRKLMSLMVDFAEADYEMLTLDGDWCKEAHEHRRFLECGVLVNESTVGASSNKHNPAFALLERGTDESRGKAYGFNLIYSGNHYSAVERSSFDTARAMTGINPHCFLWKLAEGETFVTPQAVMTYSPAGLNGMMANMHDFVNSHIVRGEHKNADRPIVLNNWEATFFNFNRRKILALARSAKKLGIEMFVLDDGWFGKRNNDLAGLGDWVENRKKLPGGIKYIANAVNRMGMKFGLWFEPECVNPDSDLYRAHPDWAISIEGRALTLGRNQLILDLTRKEVREYIIDSVDKVLSNANIEYVKWDYNRHISDMYSSSLKQQGEFFHRYTLGLYEVLGEIFYKRHPNILFESCSSGGNRFDLGMLCFSPQIWTSDNTDPIERLDIQGGIYNFYPQSCVSAHVSMAPHAQTLRDTPLSTRFNVAAFGVLGYELDFSELTPEERRQVKKQWLSI